MTLNASMSSLIPRVDGPVIERNQSCLLIRSASSIVNNYMNRVENTCTYFLLSIPLRGVI